ncbi:hypothetical protein KGS77_24070 [Streptomyces sp. MST-110588]|nr:hypothetical protein KGS77_24070 [Streptomyces sp. MST-110588]
MPVDDLPVAVLPDTAEAQDHERLRGHTLRSTGPASTPGTAGRAAPGAAGAVLRCPACGSEHVAQVLGDNGGVSFVCTACGHSWS